MKALIVTILMVATTFGAGIFGTTEKVWFTYNEEWTGANDYTNSVDVRDSSYSLNYDALLLDLPMYQLYKSTITAQAWIKLDSNKVTDSINYPIFTDAEDSTLGLWVTNSGTQLRFANFAVGNISWENKLVITSASFPTLIDNQWHYIAVDYTVSDSIVVYYYSVTNKSTHISSTSIRFR